MIDGVPVIVNGEVPTIDTTELAQRVDHDRPSSYAATFVDAPDTIKTYQLNPPTSSCPREPKPSPPFASQNTPA